MITFVPKPENKPFTIHPIPAKKRKHKPQAIRSILIKINHGGPSTQVRYKTPHNINENARVFKIFDRHIEQILKELKGL